jgi:hypothetical protein
MEYKSVAKLAEVATVNAEARPSPMSQSARLQRWAGLLEQNPERRLNSLFETEHHLPTARDAMRVAGSPISVAFADPILRGEGLAGDSYGEAKRFFGLKDHQLHHALCYCHYGATLSAGTAAGALRGVVSDLTGNGFTARVRRWFG